MSFLVATGEDGLFAALGNDRPAFMRPIHPRPGLMIFDHVLEVLFNDVNTTKGEECARVLAPHSMEALQSPVSRPLWEDPDLKGRRIAVKTMQDLCLRPPLQDLMIQKSGVEWDGRELDAAEVVYRLGSETSTGYSNKFKNQPRAQERY